MYLLVVEKKCGVSYVSEYNTYYCLRNSKNKLKLLASRTANLKRSLSFKGPVLWNSLQKNLKQCDSLWVLKKNCPTRQSYVNQLLSCTFFYIPLTNRVRGPYCKLRTEFLPVKSEGKKRGSVTYGTDRENEVSKIIIISPRLIRRAAKRTS